MNEPTPLRVVIVAAGFARRLRPLTDRTPKCLLEIDGQSMIARAIRTFAGEGVERFTIVDGFQGDDLRAHLVERFPPAWFRFVRNHQYQTTNNAYSLLLAGASDRERMLVADSDLVFDDGVVGRLLAGSGNRLALRTLGELGEEEVKVRVDRGRIVDIDKGIPPAEAAGESLGLALFEPEAAVELFTVLARRVRLENRVSEYYEASFLDWIRAGGVLEAVEVGDLRCLEVDTPEDLERARRMFAG